MMGLVGLKSDKRIGFAVQIQLWPRQFKDLRKRPAKMVPVGKACPLANSDNLSSIPRTHKIEGESGL